MDKGVYATNETWDDDLSNISKESQAQIQSALSSFSRGIDLIIGTVSNQWMRIRGAPDGDDGMFTIDFLDEELLGFQKQLQDVSSVFMFIDFIFERLRERLTLCLTTIRQRFEGGLRQSFEQEMQLLQGALEPIGNSLPGAIPAAITHCRTELQNGIGEVCEWFYLQDSVQLEDFSVRTLVAAAIENVGKCFPSSAFKLGVECNDDIRLKGRCFIPLWDAFFLVFENVVRYSGEGSQQTELVIETGGDLITFAITNPLGANQDETVVNDELERKRKYTPEMVRKEGGSGFAKLRNLIRTDLGREEDRVEFSVSDRMFTTRFELERHGLTV